LPGGKVSLDLPRMVNRMSKDPFADDECRTCQLLPLCGGRCVYRASLGHQPCALAQTRLQDVAEMFYLEQRGRRKRSGAGAAGPVESE
jgi:sulfatase maturation enzyme AslB (radical SAM superfamily)